MFEKEIKLEKENIVNTVKEVCKFNSVSKKDSSYPFGKPCNDALEYILNVGKKFGFKTKNVDGYCGYLECGEGKELIGIIGHLDVVPANKEDGWDFDPFDPTEKDGKIFARGTIDDKGPVVAALYAMKFINESCKLNKRIRLILGLNEEVDWKCIEHYKEKEEWPIISFSPDANFPCIYAEKMILSVKVTAKYQLPDGVEIIEFKHKNNAINVVPKYCSLTIKDVKGDYINSIKLNEKIKISKLKCETYKIESFGIASHAAHPELGDNAITNLLLSLPENEYIKNMKNIGFFDTHSPKYLGGDSTQDESGKLTSNIAQISYKEGKIFVNINLRIPVKTKFETIKEYYEDLEGIEFEFLKKQDALYVQKDSYIVKTLTRIFNEEIKGNYEPMSIGGGTYARAFKNCVSFGMTMPGEEDMCHKVNEYVKIDNLLLTTKIYAKALYEFNKGE